MWAWLDEITSRDCVARSPVGLPPEIETHVTEVYIAYLDTFIYVAGHWLSLFIANKPNVFVKMP